MKSCDIYAINSISESVREMYERMCTYMCVYVFIQTHLPFSNL